MATGQSAGGFHSISYTIKKYFKNGVLRSWSAMRSKNACKTCGLGMGGQKGGMVNEHGKFPEFCKKSLQAMQSDLQAPISAKLFEQWTMDDFSQLSSLQLEALGRIPAPLIYKRGSRHIYRISWEEAFEKIVKALKACAPERSFFYFSGRSSNEAGFTLQLLARQYGTNHINNCSFYCHQASGVGLTNSLGTSTATVNLTDLENSDLVILIGANPSSNHPRLLSSLAVARSRGGQVVVINPVKEPGLVRFKIPSMMKSLFFGSKIADLYIQPKIGGDMALLAGVAKLVMEQGAIDKEFIEQSTQGFIEFKIQIENLTWPEIEKSSGIKRDQIQQLAQLYINSKNTIFSWAMGVTHQKRGTATVEQIVNLALLRGMVGKDHAGLLPLRGHSNIQGMGSMGVTPQLKKDTFERLTKLGLQLPTFSGHHTMACMDAAHRGEMDFAWCLGGNLYASNPDSKYASAALSQLKLMVHMNTTLNLGHVNGLAEENLILPVLARDEEKQATTQESMFSFVRLSDGGPGRIPGLKSEVEIIAEVGKRFFHTKNQERQPEAPQTIKKSPMDWSKMLDHGNIRSLISKAIPGMEAFGKIDETKTEFFIPGRRLARGKLKTPSGKAQFSKHELSDAGDAGLSLMTVRSEGQFNTVVYEDDDHFRGIKGRDVILMNQQDMLDRGLVANQRVTVTSSTGELSQIRVLAFDISKSSALMYYPEANVLIDRKLDAQSHTPAFKHIAIEIVV